MIFELPGPNISEIFGPPLKNLSPYKIFHCVHVKAHMHGHELV